MLAATDPIIARLAKDADMRSKSISDSQAPILFLNPPPAGPKVEHENRWHDQRDPGKKGLALLVDTTRRDGIRRHRLDGGQKHRGPPGGRKQQADWNHFRARLYPESHPQGKILTGDSRGGDNDSGPRNRRSDRYGGRLHATHHRRAGAASAGYRRT